MENDAVPGWATILACILFFGSVQLFILGILGEYIGRIFEETKGRPLYLIARGKPKDEENGGPSAVGLPEGTRHSRRDA